MTDSLYSCKKVAKTFWFCGFLEGLNGPWLTARQPSNALKPSTFKKGYFYRQPSKTQVKINCQKLQSISNLTISADLHWILAAREFLNSESQFPCSQSKTVFLDIIIYNTLPPACIWKYFEMLCMKGQDNLQNTSDNIKSCPS